MRKIREVLRLHSELGCTHRQIAAACRMSPSTVGAYIERAVEAGLSWSEAEPLTEAEVEGRLFTYVGRSEPKARAPIDFEWLHRELPRTGVTLQLLWGEYQLAAREAQTLPYQYSQFCELYCVWRNQRRLSMRQAHRPGERLFIDYSGKKPCFIDADSGEVHEVELFVAVLGASNYTFAPGDAFSDHSGLHREHRACPGILWCRTLHRGARSIAQCSRSRRSLRPGHQSDVS
jgi:transposase